MLLKNALGGNSKTVMVSVIINSNSPLLTGEFVVGFLLCYALEKLKHVNISTETFQKGLWNYTITTADNSLKAYWVHPAKL